MSQILFFFKSEQRAILWFLPCLYFSTHFLSFFLPKFGHVLTRKAYSWHTQLAQLEPGGRAQTETKKKQRTLKRHV
jgi:hypothetical protein